MKSSSLGKVTLENFWNSDLKSFSITHTHDKILHLGTSHTEYDIKDKQIIHNAYTLIYTPQYDDYWNVTITTANGDIWHNTSRLKCNIKKEDNGNVIIGVNGDSQRMYVAFPFSSTCSMLMNPLMILVKIIKLRWIHILSYDQM
ncbi:hypothetical protein, partial [Providencia manganoxydans]|uniref:hypothetical protein n=1 Tax=Providencia manganoxydans TaxID=2923283 RepID=UPI0034E3EE59